LTKQQIAKDANEPVPQNSGAGFVLLGNVTNAEMG